MLTMDEPREPVALLAYSSRYIAARDAERERQITTPRPMKNEPQRPGQMPTSAGSEPIVPVMKSTPGW